MPGADEDGFLIILLIVAFTFLWIRQPGKRGTPASQQNHERPGD